ncbi:isocitrate lyase/phosphoenolpyruvate mutase family protein [Streptomyces sp. NPDC003233]
MQLRDDQHLVRRRHQDVDLDEAVNRVRSAVNAAKGRIVVTGRTDNFIQGRPDLDDTIRRLTAFAEAGADVLYAPFPPDRDALVTAAAPTPSRGSVALVPPTAHPLGDPRRIREGFLSLACGIICWRRLVNLSLC